MMQRTDSQQRNLMQGRIRLHNGVTMAAGAVTRGRMLCAAFCFAMVMAACPAQAQDAQTATSGAEDLFRAFREKVDSAATDTGKMITSEAGGIAAPSAVTDDPQNGMEMDAAAQDDAALANPLGPAAHLPLGNTPAGFAGGVPQTPAELQAQIDAEALLQRERAEEQTFESALRQLMPLKPSQVRRTLEGFRESREAAETPITEPEPKQVVETISLDPSDIPVVVKTSPGMVTTVTVLDSSGAPWPIQDVSWAGKFTITPPEEGGHVLRIIPESAHGIGNISMRLVDLVTPVTLTLRTGLDEVHYRFDARIPRNGPLAKPSLIEYGGMRAVAGRDTDMDSILDGTPSNGLVRMRVDGADGRTTAWQPEGADNRVYLRTPLTLLSPGWDSSVSSADGMNVYSLANAPVILLSDGGRMVQLRIMDAADAP